MLDAINPLTGKKYYYKDSVEAVKKRNDAQMYVDGKYVPKSHPLYKPGKYKTFNDAAFSALQNYWYKIGKAVDAVDRCKSYQTSSPHRDYELVTFAKVDDRNKAEKLLHSHFTFRSRERRGEWFHLTNYSKSKFDSALRRVNDRTSTD
jgi:hypothetical protein